MNSLHVFVNLFKGDNVSHSFVGTLSYKTLEEAEKEGKKDWGYLGTYMTRVDNV